MKKCVISLKNFGLFRAIDLYTIKAKNHLKRGKMKTEDLDDINKTISSLTEELSGVRKPRKSRIGIYAFSVLLLVSIGIIAYYGVQTTGFVTFSESVVKQEQSDMTVSTSKTLAIETDLDNINSIMLSGKVSGNGKAAVYLVRPEKKYLAYYFEGDAKGGINFTDMCYDTCHIDGLGKKNTLEIQLQGMKVQIDRIAYVYGKIIDFELEPVSTEIDYKADPAKIVELKLTNNQAADYTVLLYVDGPLSSSFSWQGSLIHMAANDTEKIIPVMIKLPSNLPKGTYVHKITARYVPPGTYEFVGEAPIAESFITVNNQ